MTWKRRHDLRVFLRSSLWPIPLACMVAAVGVAHLTLWIDRRTGWTLAVSADSARSLGATLAGSLLAFIVYIFTFLLVAVQLASAQFSPRVIARVFKDAYTKAALAVFVFTYTYSLVCLSRLEEPVGMVSGILFGYGTLACLAIFLLLIDRLGKELRPVRIMTGVAVEGRRVIRSIYPRTLAETGHPHAPAEPPPLGRPARVVPHTGDPAVVLAFHDAGLRKLASQADGVIELVPQVGDFVSPDEPLFRVYEFGRTIADDRLRQLVACGSERTLEQDPMFAFRIIVDIASKALSPAINDPTTAVLALDQIHHLLREVGNRQLDDGRGYDAAGKLRLVYRTPDWEDFVQIAVTEIRQFGRESIQVNRRLRAMLENLIETLPEPRAPLLRQELGLLHRSAERCFTDPEDRALAEVGDAQGVGGTPGSSWRVSP